MATHVPQMFTPPRLFTLALGMQGAALGSRLLSDTLEAASPVRAASPELAVHPTAPAPAPTNVPARTVVPNTVWQWRDVAGSVCANGAATGYAVNLQPDAKQLMIYLEGGGDCDSFLTCAVLHSASYVDNGYDNNTFFNNSNELPSLLSFGPTDRNNSANPMRGYSFAYFPYCTGDLHAGNNVQDFHYVGAVNVQNFMQDLNNTLSGIDYVLLAGSSAGGFGAVLNYERATQVFSGAHVDLLDDSGIAFSDTSLPSDWNLQYPSYCGTDRCNNDFSQLLLRTANTYPNTSIGLTAYTHDDTLPFFLGISFGTYHKHLENLTASMDATKNLKYFYNEALSHENLRDLNQTSNGVSLSSFVRGLVTHASNWTSERA